jgi:hypothetical protein
VCWCAFLADGFGQRSQFLGGSVPVYATPPAPASRILDEAGVLDLYSEQAAIISARLKKLEAQHGLPTYLVIYSSLVTRDVADRPRELYDAWIGARHEGVVLVCEIDSRQLEIAFPLDRESSFSPEEAVMTRFPDHRLVPLIRAINLEVKETRGVKDKVEFLDRLTATLVQELDVLLFVEEEMSDTGLFIGVTLILGTLIGLLGYFGHRFVTRAEIKSHEQFYFPEVEVGSRLGAPYGGARVNTLSFQAEREGEDGEQS